MRKGDHKLELGIEFCIELAIALYQFGREQLDLPHNFYLGLGCWVVALVVALRMFWIFPGIERLRLSIKAVIVVVIIAFVVRFSWESVRAAYSTYADDPTVMIDVIRGWDSNEKGCRNWVNTSEIIRFAKEYYLYVACGFEDPTKDMHSDSQIAISSAFEINSEAREIDIPFDANPDLKGKGIPTRTRTWHIAFLLPKEVNVSVVKRLLDIKLNHGKLINIGKHSTVD